MIKFFVFLAMMIVLGSLFSALYFLIHDQGRGQRVVNALLLRVTVSAILLGAIMLLLHFGVLELNPHPY